MAGGDTGGASQLIAMIKMGRKPNVRINHFCPAQQLFEHERMSIGAHHPGELNDHRRSGGGGSAKQAVDLLHIAYIESSEGVFPVRSTEQINSGNTHGNCSSSTSRLRGSPAKSSALD